MAVELKKLSDRRIDNTASLRAVHDVVKGGANIVDQSFQSISNSASNIDFTVQTPGLGVYMSRRVYVQTSIPVQFKFTVRQYETTANFGFFGVGSGIGVCAFPLNSLISTATVQINTSSFTTQIQQNLPVWKRLMQDSKSVMSNSDIPVCLNKTAYHYSTDQGSIYSSYQPQPVTEALTTRVGEPTNMGSQVTLTLDSMTSSVGGGAVPTANTANRVCYNPTLKAFYIGGSTAVLKDGALANADTITVQATLTVYEPLLAQPFSYDDDVPAFVNTNLLSIRLNLTSPGDRQARIIRLSKKVSALASDLTYNGFGVNKSTIWCQFITPPATDQVPTKCIYPTEFYNPLVSTQASQTILAGGTLDYTSNVITLNVAPDAIAVFAQVTADAATPSLPADLGAEDICLPIQRLEFNWNNNPALLTTLTDRDLWRRTTQNGIDMPWSVFNGSVYDKTATTVQNNALVLSDSSSRPTIGSPVLLSLNRDVPVEPGVAAGTAGVYTMTVKVTVKNPFSFSISGVNLVVVPINSQYLVLNAGATSDVINTVATEAVVAATPVSGDVQSKEMFGGSSGRVHLASHRKAYGLGPLMDMVARAAGPVAASAPAQYLASKRPHYMM